VRIKLKIIMKGSYLTHRSYRYLLNASFTTVSLMWKVHLLCVSIV